MVNEEWDFENSRTPDFTITKVIQLIKPFYSSVTEEKIKFLHHGTYNVYEVDDYIFRIPDRTLFNEKGGKLIVDEIQKLNFLRKNLHTPIPEPIFVSDDNRKPLVGYKKIEGISIDRLWLDLDDKQKIIIAKSTGLFLTELHSPMLLQKAIKELSIEPIAREEIKEIFMNLYKKTRKKIYPLLAEHLRNSLDIVFFDFLEDFTNYNFNLCITHQDFDTSNILINPNTYEITGIIDFEDMGIGDPAYDLIFLRQGKTFFETLLNNYTRQKDKYLQKRILFYFRRSGIPYLLYGIDHNIPEMISYGKYLLEKRISYSFI